MFLDSELEVIENAAAILRRKLEAGVTLKSVSDAKRAIQFQVVGSERELFAALWLNSQHMIIGFEVLSMGTIDAATVYPREVVKRAIQVNAASVIFAHNHPSLVNTPSSADIAITAKLRDALALVDVRILDHLVCGAEVFSMAEAGQL